MKRKSTQAEAVVSKVSFIRSYERCRNTPENMLVGERKQEHRILQTCFCSSHLIPRFPLIYPSPALVFYYLQCHNNGQYEMFENVCGKPDSIYTEAERHNHATLMHCTGSVWETYHYRAHFQTDRSDRQVKLSGSLTIYCIIVSIIFTFLFWGKRWNNAIIIDIMPQMLLSLICIEPRILLLWRMYSTLSRHLSRLCLNYL